MDKIYDNSEKTRENRPVKKDAFSNGGKLTEAQKKKGSLKGRIKHWSKELKCFFYLKPDADFNEIEQRYIENRYNLDKFTR